MKLTKAHLFFILLFALMCGTCFLGNTYEGMTNSNSDDDAHDHHHDTFANKHFNSYSGDGGMYQTLDEDTIGYGEEQGISPGDPISQPSSSFSNPVDLDQGKVSRYNKPSHLPLPNQVNNYNSHNSLSGTGMGTGKAQSALPPGIPAADVPAGDEDLYILKSQVVPPVCPVCPAINQKPCQPCPPCARCPEPAFECKKVPNYNSTNSQYLPKPILNNFSTFGM